MKIEDRVRLFLGSSDVQTEQVQEITGTPVEVPHPRNVTHDFRDISKRVVGDNVRKARKSKKIVFERIVYLPRENY